MSRSMSRAPAWRKDAHRKARRGHARGRAPAFGSLEQTPEQGITIGIHTILGAKKIVLVAFGARCAKAVNATLTGRPETFTPASFLQLHTDVEVYLDEAAAAQL